MIAMLLFAAAAAANGASAPSDAALALASQAKLSIGMARSPTLADVQASIERDLLNSAAAWRGPPCDNTDPKCREASKQVAKEVAPKIAAWDQARADHLVALTIDARMSPTEMAAAGRFLQTGAGQHLIAALNDLGDPNNRMLAKLYLEGGGPPPPIENRTYIDRFYDLTASLPRTTHMMIVPPPPMPSRKPQP